MKNTIGVMLLLCLCMGEAFAQKYSTALGVRMSKDVYGLSLKQKVYRGFYLEGIGSGSAREVTGTVLLEKHFPLVGKGISGYIGAGGHVGNLKDFGPTYGADALVGVEMKIPILPLTVAADFKPAYQIEHEDWFDFNTSVTVRYVLAKDKQKQREKARKKKRKQKEKVKARQEKQKTKEKKQKQKEKEQQKAEKAKAKGKNQVEEDKKLFGNVHLLQIFKKEETNTPAKGKETIEEDKKLFGNIHLLRIFKKEEISTSKK